MKIKYLRQVKFAYKRLQTETNDIKRLSYDSLFASPSSLHRQWLTS
jgi:hypothetical protein